MEWQDVSMPLRSEMAVWPGDPPFEMTADQRIAEGASCNTSRLSICTHTGTHCDAPYHFEDNGKQLHEIETAVFFGDALVIELPDVDSITADDLRSLPSAERVLFKTRNSNIPLDASFQRDFTALEADAAQYLVEAGVKLVGIDYLSVAPFKRSGPTHHILLQNNVFVVEGLRLSDVAPGTYPFVVLPLPLMGADGAPCRAFIGISGD